MKPDRFARVKDLLLTAAEMSESERQAYLDRACKGDPELRREVAAILAHDGDTGILTSDGRRTQPARQIPERIGAYRIEGMLGAGGMGVVYLARDSRLDRQVALKVLPQRIADDCRNIERFEREAKLLAALNHPNIATVYTLEEADGVHFLTMEHVPGETLAEKIAVGPFEIDTTLSCCRQIAKALEAAHKREIVHRDLKPANVKITEEGQVKVLDFGIAKAMGDARGKGTTGLTGTGAVIGTPGYMSPEQIRGQSTDHRADIWALGCVLYECLTGKHAFAGDTATEIVAATLERQPDWNAVPEDTPQALRELLERCLAKNVEERLGRVAEARHMLEDQVARRAAPMVVSTRSGRRAETRNNLPVQFTSFVGRELELREIHELLAGTRLLTLTGVGGCGKTRLGLEVAMRFLESFPNGVWLVELAPLADPVLVPQAVMSALGLREQAGYTITDNLRVFLREKTALLILDNCEHLVAACAELADTLLHGCPSLTILASSREALGITGETAYRVPSLALPEAKGEIRLEELREADAVRLFVERGAAAVPGFELTQENSAVTIEICRRLDGIPLAIELAAARLRTMSVAEVSQRLGERFRLLTGGSRTALPRHQTLRALIDWSYEHLTSEEQAVLRRLSVFAGGWSLDAAEAVCAGRSLAEWDVIDHLARLVDKSMVEVGTETGRRSTRSRYRMLETVRHYALERLFQTGEGDEARQRHRDFYLALAEEALSHLDGPEHLAWIDRLGAEHENLRAALGATFSGQPLVEARLRQAVGTIYIAFGADDDAEAQLRRAVEIQGDVLGEDHPQTLVGMRRLGSVIGNQGRHDEAEALLRTTWETQRRVLGEEHLETLNTLACLATLYSDTRRHDEAEAHWRAILEVRRRVLGQDHPQTLSSMWLLAYTYGDQGRYDEAEVLLQKCLETQLRVVGEEHPGTLESMYTLAFVYIRQRRFNDAEPLIRKALAVSRRIRGEHHPRTNAIRYNLSCMLALQGRRDEAIGFLRDALDNGYHGPKNWFQHGDLSLHDDPDLSSLHGDPDFEAIVAELKRRNEERATAEKVDGDK